MNIRELVNSLLPLSADIKDPVWIQSAREILTASLLYHYEMGVSFIDAVLNTMSTPHLGYRVRELGRRGIHTDRGDKNHAILKYNRERDEQKRQRERENE